MFHPDTANVRVGFIGCGMMGEALLKGLIRGSGLPADWVVVSDADPKRLEYVRQSYGIRTGSNSETAGMSDVIFVAVKPHQVKEAVSGVRNSLDGTKLIVSIAAGISTTSIEAWTGDNARVLRVMPNLPCLVGEGVLAVCRGSRATPQDEELLLSLLRGCGLVVSVSESLMNAVTGLSGSGPAYAFVLIEGLADGGVRVGLPRELSLRLAAQSMLGAAKMVLETSEHPARLKDKVASPGGTTMAGLHAIEKGAVRAALIDAVFAATSRSKELSGSPTRAS